MKKNTLIILMMGLLILVSACGGDDDGTPTTPPVTDESILADGWEAFSNGDLTEAEAQFQDLIDREKLLPEAYNGLGWTKSRGNDPAAALAAFNSGVSSGPSGGAVLADITAGLAYVSNATNEHNDCIIYAGQVDTGWSLLADPAFNHDGLVALAAASHYYLGNFAESLVQVQILDPSFTADVETPAGRAALAAKIEELLVG